MRDRNAFNTQVGKKGNKSTLTGQEITETQIWIWNDPKKISKYGVRNINSLGNKGMEQLIKPGNQENGTSSKGQELMGQEQPKYFQSKGTRAL